MLPKHLLFTVFLFCILGGGQAQNHPFTIIDSLQQALQHTRDPTQTTILLSQLSLFVSESNPDSGLALANKGISIARSRHNDTTLASCLSSRGWAWFRLGKNDSAINNITQSVAIFRKYNSITKECKSLLNLAAVYDEEDNNQKELDCLMTVLPLVDSFSNPFIKLNAFINIGNVYYKTGDIRKAMDYLQKGIHLSVTLHHDEYLTDAMVTLGILYNSLHQYDNALSQFRNALAANTRINNTNGQAISSENIGDVYYNRATENNTLFFADSALHYYQQAAAIFKTFGNQNDIAYEELNIGKALSLLNEKDKAIRKLTAALSVFKTGNAYNHAYEATSGLSAIYAQQQQFEKAFEYLRQSETYKNIIDSLNEKKSINNLLIKYETDKKEQDIQLLNAQQVITGKKLQQNRLVLFFSFGIIALILVAGIAILKQYRTRQQLKDMQMRNRIAGDLHDDIGSSLSSIYLLSNMVQQKNSGPSYQNALQKISHNAKEVMDKMNDIVWAMKPGNDDGSSLQEKLEKLLQIPVDAGLEVQSDIDDRLSGIKLTMDTRRNILLICKEAINNALKHAQATHISLSLSVTTEGIVINIADNGIGFDIRSASFNNGMDTMAQRARDCGGSLNIQSTPGQGCIVRVQIPLPKIRYALLRFN
ncbi:MAG: hypothetical protein J0H74_12135 [Chitinophagaceae bacterium]|nr:hypothetical protein [Chitinophagaceae bacterium]